MRKQGKLYTANKWNQPLFMPKDDKRNMFAFGDNIDRKAYANYQANPWNYTQDYQYGNSPTITEQYKAQNKNFNWGSVGKGAAGMASMIPSGEMIIGDNTYKRGLWDALDPTYYAAKGKESGAGNTLSDIGVSLTKAGAASGNGWLALAGAGAKVIGSGINAMWGTKTDQDTLDNLTASTQQKQAVGNALGQASTNEDLINLSGYMTGGVDDVDVNDIYDFGKWVSRKKRNKMRNEGRQIINAEKGALAFQNHALGTSANRIDRQMDDIIMQNFAAYGGPLTYMAMNNNNGMSAIDYGFMSDYLAAKNQQNQQKNNMTNMFAGTAPTMFGGGGKIHINPKNKGKFNATKKRTGKTTEELTHSKNPLTRKRAIFALNSRKWHHANGGPLNILYQEDAPLFALGGDLQMHGGDYTSGLIHVDAGNSHEENPYEGVQMGVDFEGTPNLVEENEVVYNDYVYSMRIPIDDTTKEHFHISKKKDMTYAELAKLLEKKNEVNEKPNDAIAQAGFASQMSQLADDQERQKAEMEAERARQAFEALSPEEQTAIMQRAAQEEQMTQEAAVQQQMQQVPTEEEVLAQQMADGSEAQVAPIQAACGGKINRFDDGGELKKRVYSILGLHTDSEFRKWAKENLAGEDVNWDTVPLKETTFKPLIRRDSFKKAIAKDNLALADALSKGYDFGINQPTANGKATIQSINKGNWNATDGAGWLGSEDLAFKQATEGLTEDEIKALTTEQLAQRMQATDAYKNTSKWLENSDNALLYLNTLLNDVETPEVAKKHARQYVSDGKWKDGYTYSYDDVFGKVRATNPGTYWHTAMEANRGNQSQNWVINDDGTIEEIIGEVPEGWTSAGNYTWAGPENNMAYNYYKRPAVASVTETPEETVVETETGDREPLHRAEWPRYAGLFGPAVGLGLMAAGVGKPDYSGIDAAVAIGNSGVRTANWKPIGNYLRYTPMDIWAEQNRLDANARATDRAIMNSVSPSKYAGLLANAYNSQLASGELYRKALEYNDAKRAQVAEFNRGTDQYNSQAYNQNQQFNADAYNRNRQFGAQLAMNAAQQKLAGDANWYNSLYGNIGGLFRGLSDLGRENAEWNMMSRLAADGYTNLGDSYTGDMYLKRNKKRKNNDNV